MVLTGIRKIQRAPVSSEDDPLPPRQLLVSSPVAAPPSCGGLIPGCAFASCPFTIVGTRSILTCPRCRGSLYVRSVDGTRCDCRPGAYADCSSGTCQCLACPRGFYCSGGANTNSSSSSSSSSSSIRAAGAAAALQLQQPAEATPCGIGLTTRPDQPARVRNNCVLLPGYGYAVTATATASLCPVGSWSEGLRSSLTPCQRCPSGLTTAREGAVDRYECQAGPGLYFQEGTVRVCPPGTYQPGYHLQGSEACRPCAAGVTTAGSAAVAAAECAYAQPGYGLTTCDMTSGCQAQLCAVGQYNVGGLKGSNSCQVCPWGLTTQGPGNSDVAACLAPPGYGVVYPLPADTTVLSVQLCTSGYNPGWNRAACTPCGDNITSRGNRTSAFDCFVLRGQGLQILWTSDGTTPVRGAIDCWPGSTGMAADTVMFQARPCDTCPRFMTTEQALSSSRSDCKALPGYFPAPGPDTPSGGVACPIGTYKPTIGNDPTCSRCPGNTSTPGAGSTDVTNCTVCLPGYGSWSAAGPSCSPCGSGTFNDGSAANCSACPQGQAPNSNSTACVSTCLPRPATSPFPASGIDCPTNRNGGGSWTFSPAGNSYSLPPACTPPGKSCGVAGGQFWDRTDVQQVTNAAGDTACACKEAQTKGHVFRWVDESGQPDRNGKLACVPGAAFLPADPREPTGAGIWVVDSVASSSCWDAPSCWDMCFFCDGSRRYSGQTPAAQAKGLRTFRKIEDNKCDADSCPLKEPTVEQKTFAEACDKYAGTATREIHTRLQLVNGVWPFRPIQSSPAVLQLPRPVSGLTAGNGVDQDQEVLQSWTWASRSSLQGDTLAAAALPADVSAAPV
ncbi:hypothetical protein OEZ86_007836 [Tetradesmus obliquus]|nr:hypothetical protein OEZ86_007836 [Tetradesmus obliquus]